MNLTEIKRNTLCLDITIGNAISRHSNRESKLGKAPYILSEETKRKMSQSKTGALHPKWKGNPKNKVMVDGINYTTVHWQFRKKYGSADRCENKDCLHDSKKKFEWAKLRGFKYELKRENFVMLCCKCHRNYDRNEYFPIRVD